MKEILEEYGEYILTGLTGIGIIGLLSILIEIVKTELGIFLNTLC